MSQKSISKLTAGTFTRVIGLYAKCYNSIPTQQQVCSHVSVVGAHTCAMGCVHMLLTLVLSLIHI